MNEPVIHAFNDGTELVLRQITMAEAIEMESAIWQRERVALMQMLDDSQATAEQRVAQMKDHYERRGLASEMTRQLFRTHHAKDVIKKVAPPGSDVQIERLAPNVACELALRCVGYELRDPGETEDEDSGKAPEKKARQP